MEKPALHGAHESVVGSSRHVFYRKLNAHLPTIVRGAGVYLYDDAGKRYLDACGGAMVACIGHGVREVADAIAGQARALAYVNGTTFTNRPVEQLAAFLASKCEQGDYRSYFLSSGSEAVEAALKLARQYHVERGQPSRSTIVALTPGYHGNTLLALSASARAHYRAMYAPWLVDVELIPAPYPYRATGDADPALTGEALETAILRRGPETIAAFIAEPIGGSSTGASVPPPGYFERVRELCDRHGILFIADEVLCGSGRTGSFFALDHYRNRAGARIAADIITLGKSLNGGYFPLSAMMARAELVEAIARGPSGGLVHAQTYSHNPLACAAALAVQAYVEMHRLIDRAHMQGAQLLAKLKTLAAEGDGAELVGDVRGVGMLAAVELVADRETKRPFERSARVAETLVNTARERGLVLWPNIGHADGRDGDLVMIAPPYTIASAEIDELVELLRASLADTHSALSAAKMRG